MPSGWTSLRIQAGWNGGADLDLHLYGPNGINIGFGGSSNGYSGSSANPEWIQVNSPPAGSYTIKVNGWYVRGSSASFTGTYLIRQEQEQCEGPPVERPCRRIPDSGSTSWYP